MSTRNSDNKDEKILNTIVVGFCGVVVFLIFLLGLIVKPDGAGSAINTEFLWDAWHPFSFWDFIGTVFLLAAVIFISGIWKKFYPNNPTTGQGIQYGFWAAGALGIVLIFMS